MAGLDLQFQQESTTNWMEANAAQVQYNGGATVKIPKITTEGLGDYSRTTGFPSGGVTLQWETRTLTRDRGKEFVLDAMDVNETNFIANAGMVMAEFQRTNVIPEVDAFRYSQIFQLANPKLRTGSYTPATGTVWTQLKADVDAMHDVIGENEPLVIAISQTALSALERSTEITRMLTVGQFTNGNLDTQVKQFEGIPLFAIPSTRFKTAYTFSATNGFSAQATAMPINWIIMSRAAVIAIVKTDKPRIFTPDVNQEMDAWKIQYRKFHDLWILDNKFPAIWVSYTPIAAPALTTVIAQGSVSGSTKFTATPGSGNTLAYLKQAGAITAPNFNDIPTGLTAYTSGADITGASASQYLGQYELDALGHVVKFKTYQLAGGDIKP